MKPQLLAAALTCCAIMPTSGQWTDVLNNNINWELRVWETEYSGSNDPFDGTCDPTVRTRLFVNGVEEDEGTACESWACTSPCLNTDHEGWWTGTDYPANISMAIYGTAFESDNADGCAYTDGDDHYWAGYYTLRDGLTDMPFLYSSTDFFPCRWINELGNGGTVWLMPNTGEFDQRLQLAWRRTHGAGADDRLDFGTIPMNTERGDVNSNLDLVGQNSITNLEYRDLQGDPSRDVYYQFTINQPSRVTIHTDHPFTDFDTKVYLTDLSAREFASDNDGGNGFTSAITRNLPPGTYGIRVEGNGSASGVFRLGVVVEPVQDQVGVPIYNDTQQRDYLSFTILGPPTCGSVVQRYAVAYSTTGYGDSSGPDPNYFFTLPGGVGPRTFQADVVWGRRDGVGSCAPSSPDWQVLIDGQVCGSCVVSTQQIAIQDCIPDFESITYSGAYGTDRISVTYEAEAWGETDQAREFVLRDLRANVDIRFHAVLVGTSFTSVLGYFDAPQVPLFILRDPPGDRSYSSVINSEQTCYGNSFSVSTDASLGVWAKARVGTEGSVGVIVETDYEIYGEVGVDLTVGMSVSGEEEYRTCLETTTEFSTGNGDLEEGEDIPGDDVFIGSAIRYAYGMAKTVVRNGCTTVRDATLEIVPTELISSYNYTESYIRNTVIPELQTWLSQLDPGTPQYRDIANQLDVWNQTLAMNDDIKANAPLEINRAFNGGGNGQTYSSTTTTEIQRTIEMSAYLDAGLTAEFGAFVGGSGVSAGGEIRIRKEFGLGATASNTSTNTMSYHLEDGNGVDNLNVAVRKDKVFGTYAFQLDELVSATSCPYEGGYQIDQPSLSVGSLGGTSMVVDEAPIGSQVNFPLIICNESDRVRSYYLKFVSNTNTEGGILEAFGSTINGNDDGVFLEDLAAGECLTANLTLTQPNLSVIDFEDIEVYVYALCEPDIRSAVSISAYFGDGNVPTGMAEEAAHATDWFALQPNPSNGLFELKPTADMGSTNITVFDGVGRVVKPSFQVVGKGTRVIDLQELPPGAYHLMAERSGEKRVVKLMVQR